MVIYCLLQMTQQCFYLIVIDIKTLHEEANQQINHLYEWFCANKLSLNAQKTKYSIIKAPGKLPNLQNYNITSIQGIPSLARPHQ